MRQFNLFRKRGIFYARFKDESTGKWLSGISTGQTDERAALATVYGWERDGIDTRDGRSVESITGTRRLIDLLRTAELDRNDARTIVDVLRDRGLIVSATVAGGPAAERLIDYLLRFWDYEKSDYVAEKRAHRHNMTRRHCIDMTGNVRRHWAPFWGDTLLGDVTRDRLREFSATLADKLHGKTANNVLDAGRVALRWAHDNGHIPVNPADRLPKYQGAAKRRDVLTVDEVRALFALDWPSDTAKLASLVAMTCGLRAGEVCALNIDDVGDDRLHVRHSWSPIDQLKTPKNGDPRTVPVLPAIRDALREHAAKNPHGDEGPPWVFWTVTHADKPIHQKVFMEGLADALCMLSGATAADLKAYRRVLQRRSRKADPDPADIDAHARVKAIRAEWSARGIVFHSWRHFYAARLADRLDLRTVQTATGHKSAAMTEHYANHASAEQFREVSDAARLAFSFVDDAGAPADTAEEVAL